jgi:hypothetical protein
MVRTGWSQRNWNRGSDDLAVHLVHSEKMRWFWSNSHSLKRREGCAPIRPTGITRTVIGQLDKREVGGGWLIDWLTDSQSVVCFIWRVSITMVTKQQKKEMVAGFDELETEMMGESPEEMQTRLADLSDSDLGKYL